MGSESRALTLVFADLAAGERGAGWAEALAAWRPAYAARLAAAGGELVKEMPAGAMAVFGSAAAAAEFAAAALEGAETAGVLLRLGLATGEVVVERDPSTGRLDYFGPVANRAARLAAAAHPGQALLAAATREAAGVVPAADLADLGEHRLRGFEAAERVTQLVPASRRGRRFPPISAAAIAPTNLPPQTTTFVGRERELRELEALYRQGRRIVSITGAAGAGKTRLAVRLASALFPQLEGGAWIADLAEAADSAGVALAVASALGVPLPASRPPVAAIADLLEFRPPLVLVLDTCDTATVATAAAVEAWSAAAPRSAFVLTSRTAVGAAGECEFRLEPLPALSTIAPGPGAAARAAASDAVRLFVDRARESRPDFELTDANAPDVVRVCAELEGLPLAVELAAARSRVLSPAELVRKLEQKFQLLRSMRQDTVRRQQTLSGAIEWSWEQLTPAEQRAFVQASVFQGGFTMEAAARVLEDPAAVAGLRSKSLLTERGGRFSMYRPIRDYASRRRAEGGEAGAAAEDRHGEWCRALASECREGRRTAREIEVRNRLVAELDNVLAAVDRDLAVPARVQRGARILIDTGWIFDKFVPAAVAIPRAEAAVARLEALPRGPEDRAFFAESLVLLAGLLWADTQRDRAPVVLDRALAAAREAGDPRVLADALGERMVMTWATARYDEAMRLADEIEPLRARRGDAVGIASNWNGRGAIHLWRGECREAIACFEKATAAFRECGYGYGIALVKGNTALAYKELGESDRAEKLHREALDSARRDGYESLESTCLGNLASVLSDGGKFEEALEMFEAAAHIDRRFGDKSALARKEGNRAVIFLRQANYPKAAEANELALRHFRDLGDLAALATALGNRAAILRAEGRREEALDAAREALALDEKLGDRAGVGNSHQMIGQFLYELGRTEEALAPLRAAREVAASLDARGSKWNLIATVMLALSQSRLGRGEEARALVEEIRPAMEAYFLSERSWDDELAAAWAQAKRAAEPR